MPGAIIAIDQDRPGPSTSFGSPGVARNDLWVGQVIRPRVSTSGNSSQEWTLLGKPPGSATTISGSTDVACSFTPDVPGSYRLQLVTNGGGAGNVQILIAACRFDVTGTVTQRGWRLPAVGETSSEDNFSGNTRGWDEAISYMLTDVRTSLDILLAGGGGGGDGVGAIVSNTSTSGQFLVGTGEGTAEWALVAGDVTGPSDDLAVVGLTGTAGVVAHHGYGIAFDEGNGAQVYLAARTTDARTRDLEIDGMNALPGATTYVRGGGIDIFTGLGATVGGKQGSFRVWAAGTGGAVVDLSLELNSLQNTFRLPVQAPKLVIGPVTGVAVTTGPTDTTDSYSFTYAATNPSISKGTGVPATTEPNGSVFFRTDGTGATDGVYTRQAGAWFALGAGAGGGTTPTGTGFYHVTGGVMDAAAVAVDLGSAHVTGTLLPANGGSGLSGVGAANTVLSSNGAVNAYIFLANANIDAAAAIAGTKVSPNFGSQAILTSGNITGAVVTSTKNVVNGAGGPSLSAGSGLPAAAEPNGSLYARTDGTGVTDALYTRQAGAWLALTGGGGGGTTPTGTGFYHVTGGVMDAAAVAVNLASAHVTGILPVGNQAAQTMLGDVTGTTAVSVVAKINGTVVPTSASASVGNTVYLSSAGNVSYGAVNLAGGVTYVTGVLPAGNQAAQTMVGDVTGTTGASVTAKVNGVTVPTGSGNTIGNALRVTTAGVGGVLAYSALNLAGGAGFVTGVLPAANLPSLAGDVTGTVATTVVAKLQTRTLSSSAPNTGNHVGWNGTQWQPQALNLAGGANYISGILPVANLPDATTGAKGIVQLAQDLGGTATAPTVTNLTGVSGVVNVRTTTGVSVLSIGTAAGSTGNGLRLTNNFGVFSRTTTSVDVQLMSLSASNLLQVGGTAVPLVLEGSTEVLIGSASGYTSISQGGSQMLRVSASGLIVGSGAGAGSFGSGAGLIYIKDGTSPTGSITSGHTYGSDSGCPAWTFRGNDKFIIQEINNTHVFNTEHAALKVYCVRGGVDYGSGYIKIWDLTSPP